MPLIRSRGRTLALFAFAVVARAAGAQADSVPEQALAGRHARVTLKPLTDDLYARTRFQGSLVRVGADSVVLRDGRRVRAFARRDVYRVELRSEQRSRTAGALRYGIPAAIVGGLGGVALGAIVGARETCLTSPGSFGGCSGAEPLPPAGTGLVMGGAFGVLGAWYGATAGRSGWSRLVFDRARVGVRATPSGMGLGVSIAVR